MWWSIASILGGCRLSPPHIPTSEWRDPRSQLGEALSLVRQPQYKGQRSG